jgi:hypothetical protein
LFQIRHDKGTRPTPDRGAVSNKTIDVTGFSGKVFIPHARKYGPGKLGLGGIAIPGTWRANGSAGDVFKNRNDFKNAGS